jgi:hypothetical protein
MYGHHADLRSLIRQRQEEVRGADEALGKAGKGGPRATRRKGARRPRLEERVFAVAQSGTREVVDPLAGRSR